MWAESIFSCFKISNLGEFYYLVEFYYYPTLILGESELKKNLGRFLNFFLTLMTKINQKVAVPLFRLSYSSPFANKHFFNSG